MADVARLDFSFQLLSPAVCDSFEQNPDPSMFHLCRLQDEYVALQEELKATIEESKLVQEKYRQLLEQARREVTAKHKECEELRLQVLFCVKCHEIFKEIMFHLCQDSQVLTTPCCFSSLKLLDR